MTTTTAGSAGPCDNAIVSRCCDGGRRHTDTCLDRWVRTQLDRCPTPMSADRSRQVAELLFPELIPERDPGSTTSTSTKTAR